MASQKDWRAWCKDGMRPPNVPSQPDRTYKRDGWQGWGHWLGTLKPPGKTQLMSFDEALAVAHTLRLENVDEWQAWSRSSARPADMPADPHVAYKHGGWLGWGHWLRSL